MEKYYVIDLKKDDVYENDSRTYYGFDSLDSAKQLIEFLLYKSYLKIPCCDIETLNPIAGRFILIKGEMIKMQSSMQINLLEMEPGD